MHAAACAGLFSAASASPCLVATSPIDFMVSLLTPMSDRNNPHLVPSIGIFQKINAPSMLPKNSIFSGCFSGSDPTYDGEPFRRALMKYGHDLFSIQKSA